MVAVGVYRVDGKVGALGDFGGFQAFGAQADDLDLARGKADVGNPPASVEQEVFYVGGYFRVDGLSWLPSIATRKLRRGWALMFS